MEFAAYNFPSSLSSKNSGGIKVSKRRDDILREQLTPWQYEVTQRNGTEPPYKNEYWNELRDGLYVDVISGVPLFSSRDKFDARNGWPNFTKPLDEAEIIEKPDFSHDMIRTEVRSKTADSHLGHVFSTTRTASGLRYCINSAALRFIPIEDLQKEGYAEYLPLFQ